MRTATKQSVFLAILAAGLAALIALALWQMAKARRETPRQTPAATAPHDIQYAPRKRGG